MGHERYAPAVRSVDGILYGGDYNPEQWPEEVWEEDVALMKAAGVNLVTVGVFSWALIEPREGEFDFSRMDRILDLLARAGIKADLATGTAAQPAWATLAYADIAPADERGMRYSHGSRQTYCPNSPSYRRLSLRLVEAVAKRYANHEALALWHVNNEVACHIQSCTCDTCAARFREWLEARYGSLGRLNEAWGTAFWSQRYGDWDEIVPPRVSTTNLNPAARLDYRRFMSDSFLGIVRAEAGLLRSLSPGIPVTTNLMWTDGADWFGLRGHIDALAYDSYPDPSDRESWRWAAFMFDLTRGHLGGEPWLLMEQAPSQVNWRAVNAAKAPGTMRLWSAQALAHGSDSVLFFQWRASVRGSEQFHSAMLPHAGPSSRRHAEVKALGAELAILSGKDGRLPGLAGSRSRARVAILYSYDAWWFAQYRPFPTEGYDYQRLVRDWHEALSRLHVGVDIIPTDAALGDYELVLAPALVLADDGLLARLRAYVESGGVLATGLCAGLVDGEGRVREGGYGGDLAALCGVRIEEYDVEAACGGHGQSGAGTSATAQAGASAAGSGSAFTQVRLAGSLPAAPHSGTGARGAAGGDAHTWYDLLEAAPGTEVLATYGGEAWFSGFAAATRAAAGKGQAFWLGTRAEPDFLDAFLAQCLDAASVPALIEAGPGVEACLRRDADGSDFLFVLNHEGRNADARLGGAWALAHGPGARLDGAELELSPGAFAILTRK